MNRARRTGIALLAALALTTQSVYGLDWGVSLDNTSGVSGPTGDLEYTQVNRAALFLEYRPSDRLELAAQASYTFSLDRTYLVDVDYLYGRYRKPIEPPGRSPWLLDLRAGRFVFADFTERVLRSRADGVSIGVERPRVDVSAAVGYTGLVLLPNTTVQLSGADLNDDADDALLGPPRVVGYLTLSLPEYIAPQEITLTFVAQQDLRSSADLNEEAGFGRVDTRYVGLGLSGPLAPQLFYNGFFYYGFGRALAEQGAGTGVYEYRRIASQMAGVGMQYFMPELSQSFLEANLLYASGGSDQVAFFEGSTDGGSTQFLSITDSPFGLVFSPRPGNLVVADVGYGIRPFGRARTSLREFQTRLRYFAFFRPTAGVISEIGANTESDARYLGSEIDLLLNYRPFSDLGMAFGFGAFFPSIGEDRAFLPDSRETELLARFDLSFSF